VVSKWRGGASSRLYELLYWVGFRPWEREGIAPELRELVEGPAALTPGRALDIGCGTCGPGIFLARHGWSVVAVDIVDRALRAARRSVAAAGVSVSLVHGDVSRLEELGVGTGFQLLLDAGCFQGLNDTQRDSFAAAATNVAASGATFLMFALEPGYARPAAFRGVSDEEIAARFRGWDVLDVRVAPPRWGPLGRTRHRWLRLRRHGVETG
jgi:SAM-dependent methyltransferase